MRPRFCSLPLRAISLLAVASAFGGCATSGPDIQTSSLGPRPQEGLRTDAPRINTAESVSPRPYAQPGYVPPSYEPRPLAYARPGGAVQGQQYAQAYSRPVQPPYQPQQPFAQPYYPPQQQYAQAQPYGYGQAPYPGGLQTGSLGRPAAVQPYPAQPYLSQRPYGAPIATGSIGPRAVPQIVEVREGDTLYSLSRRTGVPVASIVAANRLNGATIQVGQKLTIPAASPR